MKKVKEQVVDNIQEFDQYHSKRGDIPKTKESFIWVIIYKWKSLQRGFFIVNKRDENLKLGFVSIKPTKMIPSMILI